MEVGDDDDDDCKHHKPWMTTPRLGPSYSFRYHAPLPLPTTKELTNQGSITLDVQHGATWERAEHYEFSLAQQPKESAPRQHCAAPPSRPRFRELGI